MEESVLLLTMMSMMLTAGICSVLFNKLKMPAIIGYLLAGILLVNIFDLNHSADFSMETVEVLKDIGLVMLMFGIGMELNIDKIKKYGKFAALVAVIQLPLMVLSGYAFGMILFGLDATGAITLGAVISGSSTAVVAAVLKTHDRITKEQADTLVLVTIMEDIGQVLILSMVTPLFLGSQVEATDLIKLIILIIVFMAVSLYVGIKFIPRILDWIGDNTSAEVLLVMSVGLCFIMAWLSVRIGMSMAIGAFLMGVIVSQSKFCEHISEKTEPMKELFMAVFFISVGMEVTFQGFIDSLPMAIGILLVFMLSKFITVFLGYFIGNKPFEECCVCSVSLMAMGEFAFIISSEAFKNGAVSEGFYTAVIGAALMSMILLPILAKKMYAVSDWLSTKRPQPLKFFAEGAFHIRDDIHARAENSPRMRDFLNSQLKKTYFCILLIIIIEIVFSGFMDQMNDFLTQLITVDFMDSHYLAYLILMTVNLILLSIPTLSLIKSIKKIDEMMLEGERIIIVRHSEGNERDVKRFYQRLMNFSTFALVLTIDFIIMAVAPGPFGAEKSSLVVIPLAIAIFAIAYILSSKGSKNNPMLIMDEEKQ